MKTLKVKWTGIRPLVMSNPQTVQLSNQFAVTSRKLGTEIKAARKKQDEDKLSRLESEMSRNDWEASAYFNDETKTFFLPDTVIIACIRSGATAAKRGRDIDRAVIVNETDIPLGDVTQHKSLDAYYADKSFCLSGPAKIPPKTGALIWKTRCMMPTGWTLEFTLDFEESMIERNTLIEAMKTAGAMCGIGGWRPKFGRFLVETN
jgi:hypothetical protein